METNESRHTVFLRQAAENNYAKFDVLLYHEREPAGKATIDILQLALLVEKGLRFMAEYIRKTG